MSSPPADFQKLKQQHELASFHEGRVRDLAMPLVMAWQAVPIFLSVVALLGANKVLNASQVQFSAFAAALVAVMFMCLIRWSQERRALKVKAEYEREHQLVFGEPPRIELIGFALPVQPTRTTRLLRAVEVESAPTAP